MHVASERQNRRGRPRHVGVQPGHKKRTHAGRMAPDGQKGRHGPALVNAQRTYGTRKWPGQPEQNANPRAAA